MSYYSNDLKSYTNVGLLPPEGSALDIENYLDTIAVQEHKPKQKPQAITITAYIESLKLNKSPLYELFRRKTLNVKGYVL